MSNRSAAVPFVASGCLSLLALGACTSAAAAPGFDTPESAVHDTAADVYLVSNIHGAPLAKDNNGYIAKVQPEGGAMQRHWIQGGKNGVTLHAPKGLALAGDVLWVTDIDVLRKFDRTSGAPLGEIAVPGAVFLNDVSVAPDGSVYCTDLGLNAQFQPTGTDAIWRVGTDGQVSALAKNPELGQPNGLVARDSGVYVVSWRDGAFFQIDYQGRRTDLGKAPQPQLDGLVRIAGKGGDPAGGTWLTTSWGGKCIYRFDTSGACAALPGELEQPADLGVDEQRQRLLVPLFGANRLEVRSW